jgi:hypothetical protein
MNKKVYTQNDINYWIYDLKRMKEDRDQLLLDKIRILEEMLSMCEDAYHAELIQKELKETRNRYGWD